MTIPGLKPAYWADDVAHVQNAVGNPLFKQVELNWSTPTLWTAEMCWPAFECDVPFVYALLQANGQLDVQKHIMYVGATAAPDTRFGNAATARTIIDKLGAVQFSYAPIRLDSTVMPSSDIAASVEEIEHLLIWAIGDDLENQKNMFTLPGMGANGCGAWHITNTGYGFTGRMPQEIIYPWMLITPA